MFGNAILNTHGPGGARCGMHWQSGMIRPHGLMSLYSTAQLAWQDFLNLYHRATPEEQATWARAVEAGERYIRDPANFETVDRYNGVGEVGIFFWLGYSIFSPQWVRVSLSRGDRTDYIILDGDSWTNWHVEQPGWTNGYKWGNNAAEHVGEWRDYDKTWQATESFRPMPTRDGDYGSQVTRLNIT